MRKLLVILLVLLLASPVWGSVGVKQDGVMKGIATDLDFKGGANVSSDGSTVTIGVGKMVGVTTYTTLTVADSGKSFLSSGTTYSTSRRFALPIVTNDNDGVWYRFITGPRAGAMYTNTSVIIHPNGALKIYYASAPTAGYNIESTIGTTSGAVTYPTITLQAINGGWYVVEATGTWALGTTDSDI